MSEARTITEGLGGQWHGRYGLALCPAHGDRKPSLTLADAPDGRLLAHCKAGCDFAEVMAALRARGLVFGNGHAHAPSAEDVAKRKAEEEAHAAKKERAALRLWREAMPITGTWAEAYLRGRGIICPLPDSLRFHPAAWHPTGREVPAMLARIEGLARFALHRTFLAPQGKGKAPLDPNKAMLGAALGGAVRLVQGGGPLVVAEGIETALSLASGLLPGPVTVWAALSAAGMAGLYLPEQAGRLVIAPDGDVTGRTMAHRLATRATAKGWQVSMLPAPDGRDWNDVLTAKGCDA